MNLAYMGALEDFHKSWTGLDVSAQ